MKTSLIQIINNIDPQIMKTILNLKMNQLKKIWLNLFRNFNQIFYFFSYLLSHSREGEYISIQLGHKIIENIKGNHTVICGGLQATEDPKLMSEAP